MEIKDIIILKFLDQYIEASKTLGDWYISQFNAGLPHEKLEEYILKQWLPSCGYTPEQINTFESEYIKYSMDYSQTLVNTEEPKVEEVLPTQEKTSVEIIKNSPNVVANPRTEEFASQIDLNLFLINELPSSIHSGISGILEWFKGVKLLDGLDYLFNTYLPQYIGQLESEKLSAKFDEYC